METKLIRLKDGTLVEVDIQGEKDTIKHVSSNTAKNVETALEDQNLSSLIIKSCQPVIKAWEELEKNTEIDSAEIQLGISFEAEGNLYIAKASTNANISLKIKITPKK